MSDERVGGQDRETKEGSTIRHDEIVKRLSEQIVDLVAAEAELEAEAEATPGIWGASTFIRVPEVEETTEPRVQEGPETAAASATEIAPEKIAVSKVRRVSAGVGAVLVIVAAADHAAFVGWLPAIPFLAVAGFRSCARSVAEAIDVGQRRPLGTLLLLNGLNLADLILSNAAIGTGMARELNPLVLAIGPWAKLILVAGCSGLLFCKRPRTLVWPTLAFVAVIAYLLTGLLGTVAIA